MFTAEVASDSVPGRLRRNDDRLLVDEQGKLFAVADGDTGSGSGGMAAERALTLLEARFKGDLGGAVESVHDEMARLKRDGELAGDTTLTALHLKESTAQIANVGDSPCHLLRNGELHILSTVDREVSGAISQTIGMAMKISVHNAFVKIRHGDVFILGSHGVAHVLGQNVVLPMARTSSLVPSRIVAEIIRRAEAEARSPDDKTVIVVRIQEEGPTNQGDVAALLATREPTLPEPEEHYPESD